MFCTIGELGVGGAGGSLTVCSCVTGVGFLQAEPTATEEITAVAMMRLRSRATFSRSMGGLMDDRLFDTDHSTILWRMNSLCLVRWSTHIWDIVYENLPTASALTQPIGVFDSGLGGLTVARAIRAQCPNESIVYLGDTARVPYGTRSADTIIRYARACAKMLTKHSIKTLVVACNTVSAVALDVLRAEMDVPVLGVIEPGARAAVAATRTGRIGVIGTAGTMASGAYPRAVAAHTATSEVFSVAAPLLVPLVEEGWLEGTVPSLVIERYLRELVGHSIDTLVLGCTHYPMLRGTIESVARQLLGEAIRVVDSAEATALELSGFLQERGLLGTEAMPGQLLIKVTDRPQRFAEVAERFLGHSVGDIEVVDL